METWARFSGSRWSDRIWGATTRSNRTPPTHPISSRRPPRREAASTVNGLGKSSTQGDLRFVDVLEAMGARISVEADSVTVEGPPVGELRGVDLDLNAISDTAQTLAAIAPFASVRRRFAVSSTRVSRRPTGSSALATELRRIGQEVDELPDGLTVTSAPIVAADIQTYDDHRMAMSFAVTALRAPGLRILDPGCTAKTFPDFFARLDEIVR